MDYAVAMAGIFLQTFAVVFFPLHCQKMVVKHIHNHRRVFPKIGTKAFFTLRHHRVRVGVMINETVELHAHCHVGQQSGHLAAAYAVGHEVAHHHLVVFAGEVKVGQEIQGCGRAFNSI